MSGRHMPNRLSRETSPYLRQHAENPVDWYPRGGEAFRRAREEDKPIHVSVGYAAFHWCTHRADFLLREKVMIVKGAKLRAWAANDNPQLKKAPAGEDRRALLTSEET